VANTVINGAAMAMRAGTNPSSVVTLLEGHIEQTGGGHAEDELEKEAGPEPGPDPTAVSGA
jgi:hypothetical protein